MWDADRGNQGMPAAGASSTSGIGNRTDESGLTAGLLLYLTTVGLVGAAIIICFGVASFSFLYKDQSELDPENGTVG